MKLAPHARRLVGSAAVVAGIALATAAAIGPSHHSHGGPAGDDVTASSGPTFYVSPDGSDSNRGTSPNRAWRTVARVNRAHLRPGDTVLFQGGARFSGQLMPATSGSAADPITFGSYGAGEAVIPDGVWFVQDHLAFDDLTFNSTFYGGSVTQGPSDDISLRGCRILMTPGNQSLGVYADGRDWTIKGNVIQDTGLSGMLINGSNYRIEGNSIDNVGLHDAGYNAHGIYLDASDSLIIRNVITHFSTSGVSVRYTGNTIKDNFLSDGKIGIDYYQSGADGGTTRWIGNTIQNTTVEGLYVSPVGKYPLVESFIIQHNRIAPSSGGLLNVRARTAGTYEQHENVRIDAVASAPRLLTSE